MKRGWFAGLLVCWFAGLLVDWFGVWVLAEGEKPSLPSRGQRIRQLRVKKAKLEQKKRQVRQKLRKVKKRESSISADLRQTQERLERTEWRLRRLTRRLAEVRRQVEKTRREVEELRRRLQKQRGLFAKRLVSIYKEENVTYVALLMDAQDIAEAASQAHLFRKVVDYDLKLITKIQKAKTALEQKERELDGQEAELRSLRAQVAEQKSLAQQEKTRQQKLLLAVQSERAMYERYLREWEEESRTIEAMLRRLQTARMRVGPSPLSVWRGSFVRPVAGEINSGFGYRVHPVFRRVRFHTGVDIAAPSGTIILAVADGVVVHSGWRRAYGKTVIIDHGGGLATLYAHCSTLLVSYGQQVKQGQPIARVGSTGLSTGPHLHFEVRRFGVPVNPLTVK